MDHYLKNELQQKLQSDSEIWDFLRESCLDGLWYWDLENPEHEWMSREFWELFGYDPATKAHSPDSWFDIINPDDKALAIENFKKHVADPDHPYDQIVRYRHADGGTVWVRCRGLTLRDETGRATRMLGAHTDLTSFVLDAEKKEKDLARSAAHLSAVFDAAQGGIIGLDRDHNIITMNAMARDILGEHEAELPFKWPSSITFLDRTDLSSLDASADPIARALVGQRLIGEVHGILREDQDKQGRYVRISSARVAAGDTDVDAVIILQDVTEEERNHQQLERQGRLEALGQLTGGIAHDFSNLLSTLLYANSILRKELQSEKSIRLLEECQRTVARGQDLINRLLAFADRTPQAAGDQTITDLFDKFRDLAELTVENDFDLEFEVQEPDLSVHCDTHMLENALLNLVLNSRDAIVNSGIGTKILVRAESLQTEGDLLHLLPRDGESGPFLRISVSDDGPGMEDEVRRRAADPFFTTKADMSGVGLGLSMVFGFVRQAGGHMLIASDPGAGTTVSLILPMGRGAHPAKEADTQEPPVEGRGEIVLLVEDETTLLAMMQTQLEDMEYTVVSVGSGVSAWQLIESDLEFDILVSDVVMPGGINGVELARLLAEKDATKPVILLSGYAGYKTSVDTNTSLRFLRKPCQPNDLGRALREALDAAAPKPAA